MEYITIPYPSPKQSERVKPATSSQEIVAVPGGLGEEVGAAPASELETLNGAVAEVESGAAVVGEVEAARRDDCEPVADAASELEPESAAESGADAASELEPESAAESGAAETEPEYEARPAVESDAAEVEAARRDDCEPIADAAAGPDVGSNTEKRAAGGPKRLRGAAQLVAGAALAVAGVPMLVLPGPGMVSIVGGATLAGKGYRAMTGKETQADAEMAGRLKDFAQDELLPTGKQAAVAVGNGAVDAVGGVLEGAFTAALLGADLAKKGAAAASTGNAVTRMGNLGKLVATDVVPLGGKAAIAAVHAAQQGVGSAIGTGKTVATTTIDLTGKGYEALTGKDVPDISDIPVISKIPGISNIANKKK